MKCGPGQGQTRRDTLEARFSVDPASIGGSDRVSAGVNKLDQFRSNIFGEKAVPAVGLGIDPMDIDPKPIDPGFVGNQPLRVGDLKLPARSSRQQEHEKKWQPLG